MNTALIICGVAIGFLLYRLMGLAQSNRMAAHLLRRQELVIAELREHHPAPESAESWAVDESAKIDHAILTGYVGAIAHHGIEEDRSKRQAALEESRRYYDRTVAGAVARANH